jgi:hypothetical protein
VQPCRGKATVHGKHGSYWKLTRDVLSIGCSAMIATPWLITLLPLLPFAPMITLGNVIREHWFAWQWTRRWAPEPRCHDAI